MYVQTHFMAHWPNLNLCIDTAKNSQLFQSKLDPQGSCKTMCLPIVNVPAPLTGGHLCSPLVLRMGSQNAEGEPKHRASAIWPNAAAGPSWQEEGQAPHLKLLIEEAYGGDPGCDDGQKGGSNDGHGALYAAQAQQQCLSDPASTCITSMQLTQR